MCEAIATLGCVSSLEPIAELYDLFVVHAAADTTFVRGFLLPAVNLPPQRVLLIDELPLGSVVVSEIDRGVARSRFTIVVLSPAYLADRWAGFGEQIASHLSAQEVRVIPLRLVDCQLPLRLDARVTLDFTDRGRWELEAVRLRDLLHTAAPAEGPIACPYPGMRPFAEQDASRFFGRDAEIDDLIGRLDRGEREIGAGACCSMGIRCKRLRIWSLRERMGWRGPCCARCMGRRQATHPR